MHDSVETEFRLLEKNDSTSERLVKLSAHTKTMAISGKLGISVK